MIIDSGVVTGSLQVSGSLTVTGSLTVNGPINGAITGSITNAVSASHAINADTASYVKTLNQNVIITGSVSVSVSSSAQTFFGSGSSQFGQNVADVQTMYGIVDVKNGPVKVTGSVFVSAGVTAANINATTGISGFLNGTASRAVLSDTASYLNPVGGNIDITGTASIYYVAATSIFSSGSNQLGTSAGNTQTLYGTVDIKNGPVTVTGSLSVSNDITGNLTGTASYASFAVNAISASYAISASEAISANTASLATFALNADTASYVAFAQTASYSAYAVTASYVLNAISASHVQLAETASYVLVAVSASYISNAESASYVQFAQTASYVEVAQSASYVASAQTASYVQTAETASFVQQAQNAYTASYVVLAQTASYVQQAVSSSFTTTASYAVSAELAYTASYVANAVSASRAISAANADTATSASYALSASTANSATSATNADNATLFNSLSSSQFPQVGTNNTFTGTQYISNDTNATSFSSTAALYTDGGIRVTKDAFISGGLSIAGNLTVFGTSSVNYITSSVLVGLEFINLNSDLPALRYAGINVGDSGSAAGISSSFWYDSQKDNWLYVYSPAGGAQQTSSLAINGPITYSNIGNEQGLLGNYVVKSQLVTAENNHHVTSSQIFDDGTTVAIAGNLQVTGSLRAATTQLNSLGVGTAGSGTAGEIRATNDITAFYSSDERLKGDITPIENPIEKLMAISGVTFNWKEGFNEVHSHIGTDTGVIAQQIEAIELPGTVTTRDNGYKAVNYEKLNALLIEGFKVQQAQLDAQKLEIEELKAKLK